MGLFSWLFKGKSTKAPATIPQASQMPPLIEYLVSDHRELVQMWVGIGLAVSEGRLQAAEVGLLHFKERLVPHVMMENTHLYKALTRDNSGDKQAMSLIKNMHAEMDAISKAAVGFAKKYATIESDLSLLATFQADYDRIQAVLTDRIDREERQLYVLYAQERSPVAAS